VIPLRPQTLHNLGWRIRIAQIGRNYFHIPGTARLQFGRETVERLPVTGHQRQIGALLAELAGHRAPQSP
jgi:hypothetical protein